MSENQETTEQVLYVSAYSIRNKFVVYKDGNPAVCPFKQMVPVQQKVSVALEPQPCLTTCPKCNVYVRKNGAGEKHDKFFLEISCMGTILDVPLQTEETQDATPEEKKTGSRFEI